MTHPFSTIRASHRSRCFAWLAALLIAIGVATPLVPSAAAQGGGLPENVLQASVRIQLLVEVIPDERGESPFFCEFPEGGVIEYGNGSGTIISEDGYILTNHHVAMPGDLPRELENFCSDQVEGGGESALTMVAWTPDETGAPETPYRVELVESSSMADDMAVIRIAEHLDGSRVNTRRNPFPFVQFGDSDALREPESITVIGYPSNAGPNRRVSVGIFSGRGDNGYGIDWIYTDATISGGNSGGTAVNSAGQFIGIPSAATYSDCRAGDTNKDGVVNDEDGCIGLGGNYGLIIPSNIAREFAEEATGMEFEVAEPEETGTPEVEPTDVPVDPAAPLIENIEFHGADDDGTIITDNTDLRRLEACFDSTIPDGALLNVTWLLDGTAYFITELEWRDAYNPNGCVSMLLTDEAAIPFLEPGVYSVQIEVEGETFTSGEFEVFRSTGDSHVEAVAVSGRTTERETIDAEDGVLEGEFASLTVEIDFTAMEAGMAWQVALYLDGDLVSTSDAEIWEGADTGSESVRLRTSERGPFEPGVYELVVSIDGTEESTTTLEITG
jgi:S1-C subfamily serine protease